MRRALATLAVAVTLTAGIVPPAEARVPYERPQWCLYTAHAWYLRVSPRTRHLWVDGSNYRAGSIGRQCRYRLHLAPQYGLSAWGWR